MQAETAEGNSYGRVEVVTAGLRMEKTMKFCTIFTNDYNMCKDGVQFWKTIPN